MDKVLDSLRCANCRQVLSAPVALPCGHTICKVHTQEADEQIACLKCGASHANKGFIVNEALANMIEAQLDSLDFGQRHKESFESFEKLKNQLHDNQLIVDDPDYFIHETISEMKNRVLLKSERLKLRIDEITQELLDDLDGYEKRCKENEEKRKKAFSCALNEFKKQNEQVKSRLQEWSRGLNNLKVNISKWKEIKEECEEALEDLSNKQKHFEKEFFNGELNMYKSSVSFFEKTSIDSVGFKVHIILYNKK